MYLYIYIQCEWWTISSVRASGNYGQLAVRSEVVERRQREPTTPFPVRESSQLAYGRAYPV